MEQFIAYDIKGKRITDISGFIDQYSKIYYLPSADEPRTKLLCAGQNSRFAEECIESILEKGMQSEADVIKVLAWKIGKIKHRETEQTGKLCYHRDWNKADEQPEKVKRYNKEFHLDQIAKNILSVAQKYQSCRYDEINDDTARQIVDELCALQLNGIGTVYILTLLFFISKGKYPIYDRFAAMALTALENGTEPRPNAPKSNRLPVKYTELPDKTKMDLAWQDYVSYVAAIRKLGYMPNDRRLDQALWVYGHCFQQK
jgi:hypothetical protein